MKTYDQFHGEVDITDIGKELRIIISKGENFKILTGYGSTSYTCKSKTAALKSLANLKKSGAIKGFFPGEIGYKLLTDKDPFYQDKQQYGPLVKNDRDYGNDGIIFVFVK